MNELEQIIQYSKDLKLLYVEDDINLSKEMKEVLVNFFDEIVVCFDGKEGLDRYKKDKFDIVISDIKMPKMNGIEFAKAIKEINPEQNIIIISAYNDSDKLFALIKIGISDFILKPIEFNQLLEVLYKISKNIFIQKQEQEFLFQQSKMAQIGEMIDMVAHQWLQFLNVLGMKAEFLKIENQNNSLTTDKIENYAKECIEEIDELSKILNEFRDFFKEKPKQEVSLENIIKSCIVLMKDNLIKNVINIELDIKDITVVVYPNQLKQVIINIINNMVDVFNERDIKNRIIKIYNDKTTLYIEDNAGGIEEKFIDKIFNDNFTTKKTGTGKGLYLSKIIMEKIDGTISVENTKNGAKFILKVTNG